MEFTLLFAALSGVLAGWLGLRIWSERLPEKASDRLIGAAVSALLAGRLTAMISQGVNPLAHPGDIIIVRGGVSTGAASLAFIGYLLWTSRRELGALDAVAPSVILGLAGWHAGCLFRGACLGTASDLPWAWAQSGSVVTRHPVEIYAAILLIVGAIAVSSLGWRTWMRFGAAVFVVSLVRLATEPLRPSLDGGPMVWYSTGAVAGLLLVWAGAFFDKTRSTVKS